MAPRESLTATRFPPPRSSLWSSAARCPAFPNPWMAKPFVGSAPSSGARLPHGDDASPCGGVAPPLGPPICCGLVGQHSRVMAVGDRFVFVHHPRHRLRIRVDVGCGDIPVDADHRRDGTDVGAREVSSSRSDIDFGSQHTPLSLLPAGGPRQRSSMSSRKRAPVIVSTVSSGGTVCPPSRGPARSCTGYGTHDSCPILPSSILTWRVHLNSRWARRGARPSRDRDGAAVQPPSPGAARPGKSCMMP